MYAIAVEAPFTYATGQTLTRTFYKAKAKQSFGNRMDYTYIEWDAKTWKSRKTAEKQLQQELAEYPTAHIVELD